MSDERLPYSFELQRTALPKAKSPYSALSLLCGILAVVLNLFLLTSPIGWIFGIAGFIMGISGYRKNKSRQAGLILSVVSFGITFIYLFSFLAAVIVDPTIKF